MTKDSRDDTVWLSSLGLVDTEEQHIAMLFPASSMKKLAVRKGKNPNMGHPDIDLAFSIFSKSNSMSITSKNKHVTREVLEEYPEPTDIQSIVKVVCPRGNNLHEATWPDGKTALCSMPPKYRNRVWIKRNDFMIVEPIEEGDKVAAEIVNILLPPQIRHLKVKNLWPPEFVQQDPRGERATGKAKAGHGGKGGAATVASSMEVESAAVPAPDDSESEDDMSDLVANNNRRYFEEEPDDDEETESESEDEAEL
eukprot:gene14385-12570_t